MKITKSYLRKIIKEEIHGIRERADAAPAHTVTHEGYTDAPGAESYRSHPKSYEGVPEIADIDIAWRRYGSDLYEQGQKDFLDGMRITSYDEVPEEYRDKHRFYLDGYFDAKNK